MNKKGSIGTGIGILIIVFAVVLIYFTIEDEVEYESTCDKCEITGIKGVEKGVFSSDTYIYETTCGDKISNYYKKVGDEVCDR